MARWSRVPSLRAVRSGALPERFPSLLRMRRAHRSHWAYSARMLRLVERQATPRTPAGGHRARRSVGDIVRGLR